MALDGPADEFLAWEREQPERHEFIAGEIFGMVGASLAHGRIVFNLATLLDRACEAGPCAAFLDGAKLRSESDVFYPDVMVSCEGHDIEGDLGSTERHDRGLKWTGYQRLAALETYVFVMYERMFVEVFRRSGAAWTYASYVGADACIELEHPGCSLRVGDLYAGISGRR